MRIDFFLIPFVIILGLLFSQSNSQKSRLWYIIICTIVLLVVASMRHPAWMTETYSIDTNAYQYMFESSFNMSWDDFFQAFYDRYYLGTNENDIGYVALNIILSGFTHEFWLFSFMADLLFFIPFGMLLYRYGTNINHLIFAYVFYISLIQIYLIGGGRQMFAIGLDIMALLALVDRKRLRAAMFFVLGLTIHISSFLFILPLLMIRFDTKPSILKKMHLVSLALTPIVALYANQWITFMGTSSGMEKYANYGSGSSGVVTFLFLIEMLSVFCLIAIKENNLINSRNLKTLYCMAPFFTLFAPLIVSNGTMIRISLYFFIYMTLLVPYSIDFQFGKRYKTLAYIAAIGVLSLLDLKDCMTYYFFWQR